ncbi:MAG: prepilin peptidase [Elusimicrobia bacterium]|nr:prepilin peptidase [Elusimicrobiota bacterium]
MKDIFFDMTAVDWIFAVFVVLSAATDLWKRKIYNWATFPAVILGIGLNGIYSGWSGIKFALLGVLVGFLILYFFYLGGGIGAGDVKFLMGIGALKGGMFVFKSALCGILVAGAVAIFWMLVKGIFLKSFKNVIFQMFSSLVSGFKVSPLPKTKSPTLPFGFYLAVGIFGYFVYGKLFL